MIAMRILFLISTLIAAAAALEPLSLQDDFEDDNSTEHYLEVATQCSRDLDLVILVDQSRSISAEDFRNQIGFILDLTKTMNIGNRTKVALVRYAHVATTEFCFKDINAFEELTARLNHMSKTFTGSTKTYKALRHVNTRVLTDACGARPGARTVVMVLTDGMDNKVKYTVRFADELKSVHNLDQDSIISVAFGDKVAWDDMKQWSTPLSMGDLEGVAESTCGETSTIATSEQPETTTSSTTTTTPLLTTTPKSTTVATFAAAVPKCSSPVEVVILLDQSRSVSQDEYGEQKAFVQELTSQLSITPTGIHVSVVNFAHKPQTQFCLTKHITDDALAEAVSHLGITFRGSTRTYKALWFAKKKVLTEKCGARKEALAVVILLTDGRDDERTVKKTKQWVQRLTDSKDRNIRVVPVVMGDKMDTPELSLWTGLTGGTTLPGIDDVTQVRQMICQFDE